MNLDDGTWVDHRGVREKNGRKHGVVTEILQQCQGCGRWVYTLTDMSPDGDLCGGCVNRTLDKRRKSQGVRH